METIFVKQVVEGGPAEQAGLKTGDRLVAVNGVPVTDKPYSEVIQFIQRSPDYLHLLVISKEEDILQKVSHTIFSSVLFFLIILIIGTDSLGFKYTPTYVHQTYAAANSQKCIDSFKNFDRITTFSACCILFKLIYNGPTSSQCKSSFATNLDA